MSASTLNVVPDASGSQEGGAVKIAQSLARGSALLAVLLIGLMAGFFFAFAIDVAPALAQLGAAEYVHAQQAINRVVRNAGFGSIYFGSALIGFAAAACAWRAGQRRRALAWLGVAAVYFGSVFWLTRSINVPINDLMAAWTADAIPADWAALRDRWNQANLWRAWGAAVCFIAAALLLPGAWRPVSAVAAA